MWGGRRNNPTDLIVNEIQGLTQLAYCRRVPQISPDNERHGGDFDVQSDELGSSWHCVCEKFGLSLSGFACHGSTLPLQIFSFLLVHFFLHLQLSLAANSTVTPVAHRPTKRRTGRQTYRLKRRLKDILKDKSTGYGQAYEQTDKRLVVKRL